MNTSGPVAVSKALAMAAYGVAWLYQAIFLIWAAFAVVVLTCDWLGWSAPPPEPMGSSELAVIGLLAALFVLVRWARGRLRRAAGFSP